MQKTTNILARVSTVLLGLVFFLPGLVGAAELSLSPATGSYSLGKEFTVRVQVKPGGTESVNAADGNLTFDKDTLTVVKVSKEGSQFSLWTADPSFSNSAGTITFSGGTPTAFSNTGTAIVVTFKGKKEGEGVVKFEKGSILAADGKGTDVYTKGSEGTYTITAAAATPPPAPVAPAAEDISALPNGPVPLAPLINSPTHGKPELWYATTTAEFNWKFGNDEIVGIRTLLSQDATATPKTTIPAASTSQIIASIAEGEWYFFLQFKNTSGWGEVAKKKIRIDATQPSEFDFSIIEKTADAPAKFAFAAEDALSGMDRYEILLKDTVIATVRAQDMTNGTTPIPVQEGGQQMVTVRAYDKAGNVREVKKDVTLPAVVKGGKAAEEVPIQSTFTWERILMVLLALITGIVITLMRNMKKKMQGDHSVVLQGVLAVREKSDRTFQAMREEFEEMIQNLDPKPQLTPAEREFTERMKEVLEIAQGFIDAGIEDLKKTIRSQ